jgi:hypothetical protein
MSGRKEGILGIEGALPTHWKISDEQMSLGKENKILKGNKKLFWTQEVL